MTSKDEPIRLPDLGDVLEMERLVERPEKDGSTAALETDIIAYVDGIRNKTVDLIRADGLAAGDAAALRPAVRLLQTSLRPLFETGELLPMEQRLAYLRRLKLIIMASYKIGGFTHVTRTVENVVRKKTHGRVQKKGTEAAQAKRAPERMKRHEHIKEIWTTAKIKTAANIHRELMRRGLDPLPTAKTVREDLKELGLSLRNERSKG